MTQDAMPELIWAYSDEDGFTDYINMKGWKEHGIESPYEGAEYIRADLVPAPSSVDEPLEEGQWRWAKFDKDASFIPCKVCVSTFSEKVRLRYGSITWATEDAVEIGPVIQPPED